MVTRLQVKASQIGKILTSLERKYDGEDLMKKSTSGNSLVNPHKVKTVQIQAIPPFNPNKIRKSPSSVEALEEENVKSLAEELKTEIVKAADK